MNENQKINHQYVIAITMLHKITTNYYRQLLFLSLMIL